MKALPQQRKEEGGNNNNKKKIVSVMSGGHRASRKACGVTRGKRHRRGLWRIWVALFAFVCLVLGGYLLHNGVGDSHVNNLRLTMTVNRRDLLARLQQAKDKPSLDTMDKLMECTLRVGMAMEKLLANIEDDNSTAHAARNAVTSMAEVYRSATTFVLKQIFPALQRKPSDAVLEDYRYSPDVLWHWISVMSHALTAALPEYYLAVDDTARHTEVLGIGLRLLFQASNAYPAWTKKKIPLVDCARHGTEDGWLRFCERSFATVDGLELRRAAILEELIALHPDYIPLRLHYTVALSLTRDASKRDVAAQLIRKEQKRIRTYAYKDVLYTAVLRLCEVFVSPTTASTVTAKRQVEEILQKIGSCPRLLRPFLLDNDDWTQRFRGQERPDIMDQRQARRLLATVKAVLQVNNGSYSLPYELTECGNVG